MTRRRRPGPARGAPRRRRPPAAEYEEWDEEEAPAPRRRGRPTRRSGNDSGSNSIAKWAWGLAAIPLIFGIKFCSKGSEDEDYKAQMLDVLSSFECYSENSAYLEALVEQHHEAAFDGAWSSLKRRDNFDVEKYQRLIGTAISESARADGRLDVAAEFAQYVAESR